MKKTILHEDGSGADGALQAARPGRPFGGLLNSFNRDERGLSSVEALLLIAAAAIILIGLLRVFFPELFNQVRQKIQELFSTTVG